MHRNISISRGSRHRGKAVIQYRDPSDEFAPLSPGDKRFQERNPDSKPEEKKPSINLKGWDVKNYRGWDAVDDTEYDPPTTKATVHPNQPPVPHYPSTTSQLTRQVIYDGRTSLQGMERDRKKKLARRAAQSKPLHPLCRTCIVCNRRFRGHGSMLAHLLDTPKCHAQLTPELKVALLDHKEARHVKSTNARLRKKGVYVLNSDRDGTVKMDKTVPKPLKNATNDPSKTKEEKKSDEP